MPNRERRSTDVPEQRPFGESMCWRCANHRAITTARSVFVMCTALPVKYPRQPIVACPSFRPESP
jgi:hypothetical protein